MRTMFQKTFAEYKLRVQIGSLAWNAERRFSEFVNLRKEVRVSALARAMCRAGEGPAVAHVKYRMCLYVNYRMCLMRGVTVQVRGSSLACAMCCAGKVSVVVWVGSHLKPDKRASVIYVTRNIF